MTQLCTRSLPYRSGVDYFERIRHLDAPVLLDSNKPDSPSGRYDIISANPVKKIQSSANSLAQLQQLLDSLSTSHRVEATDKALYHLPFIGGFIGGLSYDLGRELETLPDSAKDDCHFPSIIGGIYLWAVVVDHEHQIAELVAPASEADELEALLSRTNDHDKPAPFSLTTPFTSNLSWPEYKSRFEKIMAYIRSGDCYQINFAQRFQAKAKGDSWQAYLKMRAATPAPFSAYLDFDQFKILSVSPERFMQLNAGQVETKPIKGTAPRSGDAREDRHIAETLQNSIKDRAENLMIVDLLRNDLGRVCEPGSVRVPALFALESYANVHHLVSTVEGELPADKNAVDLLTASFPGGSITGAPKIRAMEIIDELEPQRRAIYCGSVAYISFNGRMDSSITIRTLLESVQDNPETGETESRLDCWGGGGIVYDSVAESEYQETLHKVGKILQSLQPDFLISQSQKYKNNA
ncbi:MAG: aminodeoxychorismate synthase component I [Oceanospirillum sp.]|nr:aminodeoxychorismate synthase component I [Oceanospirillum sp.]